MTSLGLAFVQVDRALDILERFVEAYEKKVSEEKR